MPTTVLTERRCQECGDPLRGRSDKKFCCDQCRNSFNNRISGIAYNSMRRINRILKKNLMVLNSLNKKGRATISRDDLLMKEFNFNYFTHVTTNRKGRTFYFCYDQGYSMVEDSKVVLVKKPGPAD